MINGFCCPEVNSYRAEAASAHIGAVRYFVYPLCRRNPRTTPLQTLLNTYTVHTVTLLTMMVLGSNAYMDEAIDSRHIHDNTTKLNICIGI